jgi:uncharacterized repeat protein (TIGR03803 family)
LLSFYVKELRSGCKVLGANWFTDSYWFAVEDHMWEPILHATGLLDRPRRVLLASALVCALFLFPPALQSQTLTVLHTFTGGPDGAYPQAVILDAAGNLYGDAGAGGNYTYCPDHGCGVVFKLRHGSSGSVLTPLYTFTGIDQLDGAGPGPLTIAPDGSLYGRSVGFPYAMVYRLQPPLSPCHAVQCPWSRSLVYRFNQNENGGAYPTAGPLVFDRSGNIYGVTQFGGNSGCNNNNSSCGTVFELVKSGGVYSLAFIHLFSGPDGAVPGAYSGVTLDSAGNLYGTTSLGGPTRNYGTVWQLVNSGPGWTETLLYSFSHDNDDQGRYPNAGVILDSAGNLYGTTTIGGPHTGGTVFDLSGTGNLSVLFGFPQNSAGTFSKLTWGPDGGLYGTTPSGGQFGRGAVFKLTNMNGTWVYTALHDFTGGSDGGSPFGSVVFDAQGNLYGAAQGGGMNENGVVFQITF